MSKEVKINYNNTFATQHSRDYYRGASFHWSGEWMVGAHYLSDDYIIDYVVHGQVLLACAKSHLSTLDNEPKDFITDESGTVIGVVSTYWDFVLSGIVGKSPGIKIQDNYWYICKDTGVPEEKQVWENTGVKAKMELSDLTPEEIEILQEPGKEVVTEFINNTMTQETGQDPEKIMSQKATTDALNTKASKSELSAAIANEVLRANEAYQPKGDYATNTKVDNLQDEVDNFEDAVDEAFDTVSEALDTLQDNIDDVADSIPTKVSDLENDSRYQTKTDLDNAINPIKDVIPVEATVGNKLADKNFVTVSIETAKAAFKGVSASGLTEEQFLAWANGLTTDENDYVFWNTVDSNGNAILKRYVRSNSSWVYEYTLSNNSFSTSEWNAIQSGITSELVSKLTNIEAGAQVNILEGVQVSGVDLAITNKKVNVDLTPITNVIPTQASSSNQLADKNFVNSSIATSTATFRGTSAAGLTQAQFEAWLETLTADDNDYVYWNTVDSAGNVVFKRYKYNGTAWVYEYDLNNSSFTSDEWAAIQSGITDSLVAKLTGIASGAQVNVLEGVQINGTDLTITNKKVNIDLSGKVDKETGKGLSTNDYTTAEKNKLSGIESGAQVNTLEGVKVDGTELTPDSNKKVNIDLSGKVDKVSGKGLSANDFTDTLKTKLDGIASGAEVNVQSDWNVSDSSSDAFIKNKPQNLVQDANYVHTDNNYTTTEKNKLSGIASNAQINVLEGVKVDGTELTITDKKVNIDLSGKVDVTDSETNSDEFVFRQTGAGLDINAKNARIGSIKGKTLAWNQLVQNGNFTDGWEDYWSVYSGTGSVSNGVITVTNAVGRNGVKLLASKVLHLNSSHKYYYSFNCQTSVEFAFYLVVTNIRIPANSAFAKISGISTPMSSGGNGDFFPSTVGEQGTFSLKNIQVIDLTLMFGAGNEPSTVEEFEALYPASYYDYNAGELISNEAKAIETVGFNQWDEEWEAGGIDDSTGQPDSSTQCRSKNYIPVIAGTDVYFRKDNIGGAIWAYAYDYNKNYIGRIIGDTSNPVTNMVRTIPSGCSYIKFKYYNPGGQLTYNNDICINISDSSRNGTYEPHQKFTLPLNLDGIKVKSHNIWDEEWLPGIYSTEDGVTYQESSGYLASENYIPVTPSQTYYIKVPQNSRIFYYDSSKAFISTSAISPNTTFTIPSNAYYIKFQLGYTGSYANDICINLSSSFNGQYEPHGILTMTGGLKSAGSVYDEIKDGKYVKRVGEVDMGTQWWTYQSNNQMAISSVSNIADYAVINQAGSVCSKLVKGSVSINGDGDTSAHMIYGAICFIRYPGMSTTSGIFSELSGVMLYYELATPITYDLAEPIRTDYPVDKLGTERIISDTVPTTPFLADITYSEANIKDIEIEGITDYLKRNELNDELDKLQDIESGAQVNKIEHIQINGTEQTISNKTVNLPAYPTTLPASDVYSWAKASTKPSYNFSEIGGTVADSQLPDTISSDITGTAMGLKTEKLTGQEFVYRACPKTINADTLKLNRIYGKTLVWNQLQGNADDEVSTVLNGTTDEQNIRNIKGPLVNGHKFLVSFLIKANGSVGGSVRISDNLFTPTIIQLSTNYQSVSQITTCGRSGSNVTSNVLFSPDLASSATVSTKYYIRIDLTLLYGSAIDGMTNAEILAKYESDFGTDYYPYNEGTLISNDAESIETVGFNQWDEEWENGRINTTTGENVVDPSYIRSKNFIPVFPSTDYCAKIGSLTANNFNWFFYDIEKNFISFVSNTNLVKQTPANCAFIRFYAGGSYGSVYNNDICINLSDASKNGTYEPYRKSTMQLNLGSFQVRDSQGNVTTITGGLKSAGSVRDEIVGNKLYNRISNANLENLAWVATGSSGYLLVSNSLASVIKAPASGNDLPDLISDKWNPCANSYTARVGDISIDTSGNIYLYVNLNATTGEVAGTINYALKTPEVYELVEPLVYSTKAGTTEARISPNADGLSAPFCCDMTYSVADYIEYADRAGALVKGASVDLTDIAASEELSGNAFKVIAEHIAKLTARVEVLEVGVGIVDTLSSTSVDSANGYYINGDKTVIIGSGAPTIVPAFAGQFYINTSGPALYYAVNNSATTDWKQA